MIVNYSYLLRDGREVGFYQCEDTDFNKMWAKIRPDVRSCIVKRDGETWIYFTDKRGGHWSRLRPRPTNPNQTT